MSTSPSAGVASTAVLITRVEEVITGGSGTGASIERRERLVKPRRSKVNHERKIGGYAPVTMS
jgi:hypothetical protein